MTYAVRPIRPARPAAARERAGGVAALLTAAALLFGLAGFAIQQQGLGLRNWLVVLFQMNSGLGSLPADPLRVFNPLDVAILALVGLTFLGLWPVLGRVSRTWTAIAIVLPFVGIALLLVTGLTGRSAVMGAGLVISVLTLLGATRGKLLAFTGLAANALLLAGDFGTGLLPGAPVAAAVGLGYFLLFAWLVLIAVNLLTRAPLARAEPPSAYNHTYDESGVRSRADGDGGPRVPGPGGS